MDPTLGSIHYNTGDYIALEDGYVPYHYEDEVQVLPLLGRDSIATDRYEVLQTSARRAQVCTFQVLCATAAARDALLALWATQTTHDDASGAGSRNVTVISTPVTGSYWGGSVPEWVVTVTVRTR